MASKAPTEATRKAARYHRAEAHLRAPDREHVVVASFKVDLPAAAAHAKVEHVEGAHSFEIDQIENLLSCRRQGEVGVLLLLDLVGQLGRALQHRIVAHGHAAISSLPTPQPNPLSDAAAESCPNATADAGPNVQVCSCVVFSLWIVTCIFSRPDYQTQLIISLDWSNKSSSFYDISLKSLLFR